MLLAALVAASWAPPAVATTIVPTTTADDAIDNGNCTLREAAIAANTNVARDACPAGAASPGVVDTIDVPAGTYTLTVPNPNPPTGAAGDLDLTDSVVIDGAGARATRVVGGPQPFRDRIFTVFMDFVTISDLTVTGGVAEGDGGGIGVAGNEFQPSATGLILDRVTISGNTAEGTGGGLWSSDASLTVNDTTVAGNTAFRGAGIVHGFGPADIYNSTITRNVATASAGGILVCTANTNIRSSTIALNESAEPGGGISVCTGTGVTVRNTIVGGNSTTNCAATGNGAIISSANNLDSGASCGFTAPGDLSNVDPLLGPLADNGGPTDTLALSPCSPAIDAGNSNESADQRGVARPQDGDLDGSLIDDIGAFELQPAECPPPDSAPPALELSAKKRQQAGEKIKVKVVSDEACALELTGSAKPKGEPKGKLKPETEQLQAGVPEKLKLKPSPGLKRALAEAGKGKAKITGACTDAAGNAGKDSLKLELT
jgi:CSLREA domain-containing protein